MRLIALFSFTPGFKRTAMLLLLVVLMKPAVSQTFLRITSTSWGRSRVTDIYPHTQVKFKVKGRGFRRGELLAMRDSLLFFRAGDTVKLADLRGIRIPDHRYSLKPLQGYLMFAGLVLIPLSALNQVITGRDVSVTPGLLIVSASLTSAGLAAGWFRTKRIRTGKHAVLKVLDLDHENMRQKAPSN